MGQTYAEYLNVADLLSLQKPKSKGPVHNEMLFIIIHQAYELWFKQILHETDHLVRQMLSGDAENSFHTIKRIRSIFKVLVHQWDILETMTPAEFLSFRDDLGSASGFQSFQFREFEFAYGYKRENVLSIFEKDSKEYQKLKLRLAQPSVWDGFLKLLAVNGCSIPEKRLHQISNESTQPSKQIQNILKDIYHSNPRLTELCEALFDVDEGIQEWRYHHVKMVERVIGSKPGTGGSSGAEYLRNTLFKPFFPDLWEIRSQF